MPFRRTASGSPTQSMAVRPSATIALTFFATSASVSLNRARRSEWPAITYLAPRLFSMPGPTAPVYGPASTYEASWAPKANFGNFSWSEARYAAGGQNTTAAFEARAAGVTARRSCTAAARSLGFSFQLATINFFMPLTGASDPPPWAPFPPQLCSAWPDGTRSSPPGRAKRISSRRCRRPRAARRWSSSHGCDTARG